MSNEIAYEVPAWIHRGAIIRHRASGKERYIKELKLGASAQETRVVLAELDTDLPGGEASVQVIEKTCEATHRRKHLT